MLEIWNASIWGFNLLPTLLLGLTMLYWLLSILGAVDSEFFGLHGQGHDAGDGGHSDGDGHPNGILVFLNFGEIPLMLIVSFTVLFMWIIAVVARITLGLGIGMSGLLLVPNFVVSLLLTKVVTTPLKGLVKSIPTFEGGYKTIGQVCTLLVDIEDGVLGQAEISTDGAPVRINVKTRPGCSMQKGTTAIVLEKDHNTDYYIITPFVA